MPEPAAPHHGPISTLPPPSANGSASRARAAPIPPGGTVSPPPAILTGPPALHITGLRPHLGVFPTVQAATASPQSPRGTKDSATAVHPIHSPVAA